MSNVSLSLSEGASPQRDETSVSPSHRRRVWRWVALGGLLWVALVSWSLASPVGAEPDSDYHLARLYCAAGQAECAGGGSSRDATCFSMRPEVSAECSDWGSRQLPATDGISDTGHYPPFFYPVMSVFVGETLADTTLMVRVANSTLTVLLVFASVWLSAPGLRNAVALAWLVASVPLGISLLTSLNPNAWAVLGIAAFWGPMLSFLSAPGGSGALWGPVASRRLQLGRALFVLACAALALAGRSETQVLIPIATIGVAMLSWPWIMPDSAHRRLWRRWSLAALLILFSVISFLVYSPDKVGAIGRYGRDETGSGRVDYEGLGVVQQVSNTIMGLLGVPWIPGAGLGTFDVPVPTVTTLLVVAAYGGAVIMGLAQMYGRKAAAIVTFSAAVFTLMAVLWSRVASEYFQPRYFLPVSFVFVGLVLLPRPDWVDPDGWVARGATARVGSPAQWAFVLGALAVANSAALLSMLLRYIRGVVFQLSRSPLAQNSPDINPDDLRAAARPSWWWEGLPVGPFGVWVVGTLAFAGAVALVWWLLIRTPTGDGQAQSAPASAPQAVVA